ncbi:3-hydroxyisobutyryl-CoA hydrolase [Vermiconidia calcicola]|uniref:3-hydroxyisobutyryl-CoA hydrolase n=1 Tax=Vermiconidia calcicola TaxID=1690605 RepID=A0ACC3N8C7_9PEZI|nr:3-hydroxyisobutyryl-CoA hydrolase [Vermiconidia calcicola]
MPLRAKIQNPAMSINSTRKYAYATTSEIKEESGDDPSDVLFGSQYGVRTITLNRPKKLNSLDASMCRKIVPRLIEWSKSQMANVVVIKGEGRAFCAGGDIAALALQNKKGPEEQNKSKDFFALEYKLDHLIATYTKPYVAFLDGITMGGGVGLSINAPIRIATENTVFAMPETTIGFFPDVGASFFLPRLDGQLGMYLALTSEQLKGVNVFYAGVATHYIHSSSLPDLEARLSELDFKDNDSMEHRLRIVNSTIEEFCTGLPHDQPVSLPVGGKIRQAIDYAFQPANENIEKCLQMLQNLADMNPDDPGGSEVIEWAKKTKKTILQRSPTSVKVAYRQLRESPKWSIAETFIREQGIASRFMEHQDFIEGVSALLIDKPRRTPNWSPNSLDEVSDSTVQEFFPPMDQLHLQLLRSGEDADYKESPYAADIGLPRERVIEEYITQARPKSKDAVVQQFVQRSNGKQGVEEKVEEFLLRKTDEQRGQVVLRAA